MLNGAPFPAQSLIIDNRVLGEIWPHRELWHVNVAWFDGRLRYAFGAYIFF
jgi:hypothetical protein